MFEHFTFGAAARPEPSEQREVSPLDTTIARSQPPTDAYPLHIAPELSDLVTQLSSQSLHPDEYSQRSYFPHLNVYRLPSPDEDYDKDCDLVQSLPSSPQSPTPMHDRRLQRQIHTQLQTSAAHMRSISALVEEMIATGSQCNLTSPPPSRGSDAPDYFDQSHYDADDSCAGESASEMSLRRASAPSGIRKGETGSRMRRAEAVARSGPVRRSRPKLRIRKGAEVLKN
jgi:hypothetical protein